MNINLNDKTHIKISLIFVISSILFVIGWTWAVAFTLASVQNWIKEINIWLTHMSKVIDNHNWRITYLEQSNMK